jgi:biopolymer transport protein TolR
MPAVHARGHRRRGMNEINMVPFIDVMLVLLIIFMVSAPLITTGLVDVPTVGKARQRPATVVEIVIGKDKKLQFKRDGKSDPEAVSLQQAVARAKSAQGDSTDVPVVISAEKTVVYEEVVKVMDALQRNGVQRVGLSVKQGA